MLHDLVIIAVWSSNHTSCRPVIIGLPVCVCWGGGGGNTDISGAAPVVLVQLEPMHKSLLVIHVCPGKSWPLGTLYDSNMDGIACTPIISQRDRKRLFILLC
jgi:hypothetical protein